MRGISGRFKQLRSQKGFTLIELMATLVILALLIAIAVPAVGNVVSASKVKSHQASIDLIEHAGELADLGGLAFDTVGVPAESYKVPTLATSGYLKIEKDHVLYEDCNYVTKQGNGTFLFVQGCDLEMIELIEDVAEDAYEDGLPFDTGNGLPDNSYTVPTIVDGGYIDMDKDHPLYQDCYCVTRQPDGSFKFVSGCDEKQTGNPGDGSNNPTNPGDGSNNPTNPEDGVPGNVVTHGVRISAGDLHTLVIKADGSIDGWGSTQLDRLVFPSGNNFVSVAAGANHSTALRSDGSLVAWGWDEHGQVSNVPSGNDFVSVSTGNRHNVALKSNGSLVAWGWDGWNQIKNKPTGNDFTMVSSGGDHSVALKSDGSLVAWGNSDYGEVNVPSGNDFVSISAGRHHNVAIKKDGSLVAWGWDVHRQVRNVPSGNDFVSVSSGAYHSIALKKDGSVVVWGSNLHGEITDTPSGNDFVAVSAGYYRNEALRSDGSIVTWGSAAVDHPVKK